MDKKILEIIELLHEIQKNSNFAVFYEYLGHIDKFVVTIRESKEKFQNYVFDTHFWNDEASLEYNVEEQILFPLKDFCKEHNLNVGGLNGQTRS